MKNRIMLSDFHLNLKTKFSFICISNLIRLITMFVCYVDLTIGAVQKLRNGQRGEGVDDFVTYCYIYLRGRGVFYEIVT